MKNALFSAISLLNVVSLNKVRNLHDIIAAIITAFTANLLLIIDSDRMHHAKSAVEQNNEITELQVLENIEQVRNEAVRVGAWNEEHEFRLNFFGNLLCNEYDWEVEQVERYLHEVISTGPSNGFEE
jgi:hypothetical protein